MSLRWTEEELEKFLRKNAPTGEKSDAQKAGERMVEFLQTTINEAAALAAGKERHPTEDEEQMALFTWANHMAVTGKYPELIWLYHVPNGGSRGPGEAGRFKAMGVKPGVPDVALDEPRGGFHGLRIEMKRRQGGRVSPAQREWIDHYNQIGYRAVVCYGWDEAREAIEEYLRGGNP